MQNNNLEIFSVKKYSMKQDKIKKLTGNIKDICDVVSSKNKGYHLKLLNDNNVILFGDIDQWNIYRKMAQWKWTGSLENAYRKMYI